jgi:uncharacterized protein
MKNELYAETSPYLLQHANNPVHWQAWSNEILQTAKELNKPILVSIGYSACHWCHVMEHESFENEATAALMNEYFINIKIDREERPDLDHIYMDAVQAITGSGGWPLNVFLTPDAKPFYGGTYFPPTQAHGRASWSDVLLNIHGAWMNRREEMEQQADTLVAHLKKSNHFAQIKNTINIAEGQSVFTKEECKLITKNLLELADKEHGGFGGAPKFPQTFSINYLLQAAHFFNDSSAQKHAEKSLSKMMFGGIYDQLGGGLCRYSTDKEWLAPHFEKMLYDNALFMIALCNAALYTKKEEYKIVLLGLATFLEKEMKCPTGGYYAAIDADSEGIEGKFYVWDKEKVDSILGEHAKFVCTYFDISEEGNWEEKNILQIKRSLNELAQENNISLTTAETIIQDAKIKLLEERNKRIRPTTDDKILLGWNALLITGYCKMYAVFQNEQYKKNAIELFNFIEDKFFQNDGSYFHTYKKGVAKYPAFLDDYAYYIDACIQLQEISSNQKYLWKAKELTEFVFENFSDEESEFFFFTQKSQTDIIVRKIELYDGATPSANSIMAKNIHYLSLVFNEREWHTKFIKMIDSLKTIILKHPNSFGIWASAAVNLAFGINEISIIGIDKTTLLDKTLLQFIPNKILISSNSQSNLPMAVESIDNQYTLIYLCKNNTCFLPCKSVEELLELAENKI